MNAWQFSAAASGPLLQDDSWYFLDAFVSKYFDGTLQPLDIFVQRGASDHSQPLQKLILLFHTKYFDMDFRIEGMIGTALGIAWCWLVAREVRASRADGESTGKASLMLIALVYVLGLSLNSTGIFTWSLVTLGYLPLVLATLYFSAGMRSAEASKPATLFFTTFLLGICIDEIAIIVVVAALITGALLPAIPYRRKIHCTATVISGLVVARIFLWYVSIRGHPNEPLLTSSHSLVDLLLSPGAFKGLMIPFADSLLHYDHLVKTVPAHAETAMMCVAAAVAILHAYFWLIIYQAWRKSEIQHSLATAVFLMLVSYALTAGVIFGRVPIFGWDYLHQPRYVLSYQIGLVAIAVALHFRTVRVSSQATLRHSVERGFVSVIFAALLILQLYVSRDSWQLPHYLTSYWQNSALTMQRLAKDPSHPQGCPSTMPVCEYPESTRSRLMNLLVTRQLNIFSGRFQMRNRLYPSIEAIPGFAPEVSKKQTIAPGIQSSNKAGAITLKDAKDQCAERKVLPSFRLEVDTNHLAPDGAELWVDTVGATHTLLRPNLPDGKSELSIDDAIENDSILTLIRANDQSILAQLQLRFADCTPVSSMSN
ncbi:hypothetical protein K5K93_09995 [Stenotrophomonas sp. DR822]|uniref:hypothetical protein n=1 Tax=Stenotrophomonas sp. DR822 TaxID=2871174 RepID=UPI001C94AA29|nr:hypothetical protein [Stenotrophomonas sp. DR822]QZN82700.1 hypothetical protein K5K93_09995 [Stenotrophomonas sp. DR822]